MTEEQTQQNEDQKRADALRHRLNGANIEIFRKYFNLRPLGNLERAWEWAKHAVIREKDQNGDPVTYELIFKKWEEYLAICKQEERPDRYIRSMESFIKNKEYNTNFTSTAPDWINKWST